MNKKLYLFGFILNLICSQLIYASDSEEEQKLKKLSNSSKTDGSLKKKREFNKSQESLNDNQEFEDKYEFYLPQEIWIEIFSYHPFQAQNLSKQYRLLMTGFEVFNSDGNPHIGPYQEPKNTAINRDHFNWLCNRRLDQYSRNCHYVDSEKAKKMPSFAWHYIPKNICISVFDESVLLPLGRNNRILVFNTNESEESGFDKLLDFYKRESEQFI